MATVKKMQKGGKMTKAQKGKKLPLGASSASAEKDYAQSDSLRNITKKGFTSKQIMEMMKKGKRPSDLYYKSDSLRREGDRKTEATDGVKKDNRFKTGGTLSPSKKSVGKTIGKLNKAKSGTKMSKKK